MRIKPILFGGLILIAFFIDLFLGTSAYPKSLLFVCAIVAVYEFVSPYIYTPS